MDVKYLFLSGFSAAALASATASHAATVTVETKAGVTQTTEFGIREDTFTHGRDLVGMEIVASFADGSSETLIWDAVGLNFGVVGSNVSLFYKAKNFDLSATSVLTSLSMDAGAIGSVFDILYFADGDTPTSYTGTEFTIRDENTHEGEIKVTYSNDVGYKDDPIVGDLYTTMNVDFTGLNGGGLFGDLAFQTDLDTLAVSGDLTPEVPLPSGLPLLASGALLFGLVRRKKR